MQLQCKDQLSKKQRCRPGLPRLFGWIRKGAADLDLLSGDLDREGATTYTDLHLKMNARGGAFYPDLDLDVGLEGILEMSSRAGGSAREGGATTTSDLDRYPDLDLDLGLRILEMSAREGGATATPDLEPPVGQRGTLEMIEREGGAVDTPDLDPPVGLQGILEMSVREGGRSMPDLDLECLTKGRRSIEAHSPRPGVLRKCNSSSRRTMSVFLYGQISQSVVHADLTCWT